MEPTDPPGTASPSEGYCANQPECPAASGRPTGTGIGRLSLGMKRSRGRRVLHFSTRGRRYVDFFCLKAGRLSAGYPTPAMLRGLTRKLRPRCQGRVVLPTTAPRRASRRSALDGPAAARIGK